MTLFPGFRRRSRGLPRLIAGCVVILLLSLSLNGALTMGALKTVFHETAAASVRVTGHDWALRIQGAIRFGKPIEQFFGLDSMLAEIAGDLPRASLVAVTLADGEVVQAVGPDSAPLVPDIARALRETITASAAPAATAFEAGERHLFIFPIAARDNGTAGTLVIALPTATLAAALAPHLEDNIARLLLVAGASILALVVGLILLAPLRPGASVSRMRLYALPVAVLVAAQGLYSWQSIQSFQTQYREQAAATAGLVADRLERDLESLFNKGVSITRLAGIEHPLSRIMAQTPEIAFIAVRDPAGLPLYRVQNGGHLETGAQPLPVDVRLDTIVPLNRKAADGAPAERLGDLRVHLSAEALAAGVRQRVLDAGTVLLTAALFMVELFILLGILVRRRPDTLAETADAPPPDTATRHILARPGAFLLVFAWALPLSFIPLRMREVYTPMLGLPEQVVLALPISAEMLCALITALLAGSLMDKKGWHVPFLGGVIVSLGGAGLSALAPDALSFILARAVVGLGYGLAWMGIQGFIFHWATPETRARGLANLVAGIFAGHITGSATGAMMAQQGGFTSVFLLSAALTLIPAAFALVFMRPYMRVPDTLPTAASTPAVTTETAPRRFRLASIGRLLRDRDFAWLLLGSVVPFSVAQVGLLYYTLPLYLSEQGVSQSNIGRIMMIYGLSVIYLGPLIGRYVDRAGRKKMFIAAGGLVGGSGMAYLTMDTSLAAMMLSVFLLGLASCLAGAAQSAYALKLPVIQEQGRGTAMGVQRAADKLGQMIGPLLVGMLFAAVGTDAGLGLTGVYYLAATVAFILIAREAPRDPAPNLADCGKKPS